jgi:hypothetical protein
MVMRASFHASIYNVSVIAYYILYFYKKVRKLGLLILEVMIIKDFDNSSNSIVSIL